MGPGDSGDGEAHELHRISLSSAWEGDGTQSSGNDPLPPSPLGGEGDLDAHRVDQPPLDLPSNDANDAYLHNFARVPLDAPDDGELANDHEPERLPLNAFNAADDNTQAPEQHSPNASDKRDDSPAPFQPDPVLLAWKWELCMLALSCTAFLALIVTLAVEDGKPVRRWGPLTLNAINAILTTVIGSSLTAFVGEALSQNVWNHFSQRRGRKGAFVTRPARDLKVFDEASRGPMGSILLLGSGKIRTLAAIGAIVTLLNLGFSTFTQNLITTEFILYETDAPAGPFPRSQGLNFDTSKLADSTDSQHLDYSTFTTLIAAGITGNNAVQAGPDCPTGNCKYHKQIPTLEVCGGCTDVSDKLDHRGNCTFVVPLCNGTNGANCSHAMANPCKYALPNGPSLTFQRRNDADLTGPSPDRITVPYDVIWNATNLQSADDGSTVAVLLDSLAYHEPYNHYVTKFAAIGLSPRPAEQFVDQSIKENDGPQIFKGTLPPVQAHECALWFCLNLYDLNVDNGTVARTLTKSYTRMYGESFIEPDFTQLKVNGQIYGVSSSAYASLASAAASFLPANNSFVTPDWGLPGQYTYGSTSPFVNLVKGLFQHSDDLEAWIGNMALALTGNIARVAPARPTAAFDGTAFASRLGWKMRWYWISLPVIVILLSAAFLAATIVQTRRRVVRAWRANALALVAAGVDDAVRADMRKADQQMGGKGGGEGAIRVGLRRREGAGWVFGSGD